MPLYIHAGIKRNRDSRQERTGGRERLAEPAYTWVREPSSDQQKPRTGKIRFSDVGVSPAGFILYQGFCADSSASALNQRVQGWSARAYAHAEVIGVQLRHVAAHVDHNTQCHQHTYDPSTAEHTHLGPFNDHSGTHMRVSFKGRNTSVLDG